MMTDKQQWLKDAIKNIDDLDSEQIENFIKSCIPVAEVKEGDNPFFKCPDCGGFHFMYATSGTLVCNSYDGEIFGCGWQQNIKPTLPEETITLLREIANSNLPAEDAIKLLFKIFLK